MADNTVHSSTCIGIASLVIKSANGEHVGHVKSLTDTDVATIKNMVTNVTSLVTTVTELESKIILSPDDPSGGTAGQLWFKYEA